MHVHMYTRYTCISISVQLLKSLWLEGGGDKPVNRVFLLPKNSTEFEAKFDEVQKDLDDLCGMDDLLTGIYKICFWLNNHKILSFC